MLRSHCNSSLNPRYLNSLSSMGCRPVSIAMAAVITIGLFAAHVSAEMFYVSPTGQDTWSGKLDKPNADNTDGPLASLTGARDVVRKLKAAGPLTQPVRVIVADGTYTITQPIVFEPADSGTDTCPISYEAAVGAKPIFNGGYAITGWTRDDNNKKNGHSVWTAHVPQLKTGAPVFEQLWVNGQRATRARTPNKWYFYMAERIDEVVDPATKQPADMTRRMFAAHPGDLQSMPNLKDAMITVFESWEVARVHVADYNPETRQVMLKSPTSWPLFNWGANRYIVENIPEALDEPGEWYLSRDGVLSYIPQPGEEMTQANVIAPLVESFVQMVGHPEKSEFVENLSLNGLRFLYAGHRLGDGDYIGAQAAVQIPAVINADGARYVQIRDCEIAHIGSYGIWFKRGCHDCRVERNYIHDLGAGGVRVGEPDLRGPLEQTSNITVDNNIIRGGGRTYPAGIGVWVGQSSDNRITHNEISDFFYTGISLGWTWGYGPSLCVRNTVDLNHIHHLGQGVLSDMGAVYTLGRAAGTTVSHNVAHDIYAYGYGGWGLYPDEGTSNMVLENNLVYNTKTGGFHQHYGRDNIVRNNIFAFALEQQLQRTRTEPHQSFKFTNNIIYYSDGVLLSSNWADANYVSSNNLFWKTNGPVKFYDDDLATWQKPGREAGSIVADPRFENAAKFDFRLKSNSPAEKIGFKPFDYSKAGVYGKQEWIALANSVKYPPIEFAPPARPPIPLTLHQNFETLETNSSKLPKAIVEVSGGGDSISIVDNMAASGKKSLRMVDAPGLSNACFPYLHFRPAHSTGLTETSFDIRVSEHTFFYHEWRDDVTSPYKIGPKVTIREGQLEVSGMPSVKVPVNQWLHVKISSQLGPRSPKTWDLQINQVLPRDSAAASTADAGNQSVQLVEPPLVHWKNLKYGSNEFKELRWYGMVSNGDAAAEIYLDNLELTNKP